METHKFSSIVIDTVIECILKNQDELSELSERLFKNQTFLVLLENEIEQELKYHKKNVWWKSPTGILNTLRDKLKEE